MAIEVGKTRLEALGEVEEAADLIRYYAKTAEDNAFYDHPMDNLGDAAVHTRSILRPHGVFAVISPFNFPMALVGRPVGGRDDGRQHGRVQAGVASPRCRPSTLMEAYRDAGVPDGVFNLVMGPGDTVGDELQDEPGHRRDRVHGLVRGRASSCSGTSRRATRGRASWRWAARTRPSSCKSRRPRGGGRGHHARGVRLRRAEVLGQQPRLRRAAGPRRAGPAARREDREARGRRPARRGPRSWARSSTSGRSTATSRRSPRRAATARCSPAASG